MNNNSIQSILLVGGTHGNELTGVHCVKYFQETRLLEKQSNVVLHYLIANPKAVEENKRYCEQDLNRSFKSIDLANQSLHNKEQFLAKNINQQFGNKGKTPVDFIIDLHTSTTNMQTNIVLTKTDLFHLKLAAYLKSVLVDVVITSESESESELMDDHHFLESIAPKGVLIEIGPIAQGTLDYSCFDKTKKAVEACLDFVQKINSGDDLQIPNKVEIMNYQSKIYFPLNKQGEINACVHPDLIGKAYPQIKKGDAIFKSFYGDDILYDGEPTFLAFINEAAYYDQKIAMCLCNPITHTIE